MEHHLFLKKSQGMHTLINLVMHSMYTKTQDHDKTFRRFMIIDP